MILSSPGITLHVYYSICISTRQPFIFQPLFWFYLCRVFVPLHTRGQIFIKKLSVQFFYWHSQTFYPNVIHRLSLQSKMLYIIVVFSYIGFVFWLLLLFFFYLLYILAWFYFMAKPCLFLLFLNPPLHNSSPYRHNLPVLTLTLDPIPIFISSFRYIISVFGLSL